MIAEIYHKTTSNLEDELTGDFFGIMRYLPFQRGLKQIICNSLISMDFNCNYIINNIGDNDFQFSFWKRSKFGLGEIDGSIDVGNVAIGIEVKYFSNLSGENQLEREAAMLEEWYSDSKEKVLIFVAPEDVAKRIYFENYQKDCFNKVHLGYITWQDILNSLDTVDTINRYEEMMVSDLKALLKEKGFISFDGFQIENSLIDGGVMSSGENIHNAFQIVFKTLQNVEKLISKCKAELDDSRYYMPTERFMRYNSDTNWEGWIYWSFILLFQRKADGSILENNGWIDAPIYAVEINLDSDTCDEPEIIIAKMQFDGIRTWSAGCSSSNHGLFYAAIHGSELYEQEYDNGIITITAKKGYEEEVANRFWGFKSSRIIIKKLVDVTQKNYKDIIFGSIEELSKEL